MRNDFVNIHGPEHHFLDGAAFIMAYKNAGGQIDAEAFLAELAKRTIKMPGAMCGYWGICGSVASAGAALGNSRHQPFEHRRVLQGQYAFHLLRYS